MDASFILASAAGNSALMGLTKALGGRSPDYGIHVVGVNRDHTETESGLLYRRFMAEQELGGRPVDGSL
jgi:hypothetical protein